MKIYFTTNSSGGNTEGIGAMAQYQIICYLVSKLYKVEYYFNGFKDLFHYQYFDITQEKFCEDFNNFFNLPITKKLSNKVVNFEDIGVDLNDFIKNGVNDNIIINFTPDQLLSFMDDIIHIKEVQHILKNIGENIKIDNKQIYFNENKLNIAYHIRKYTQTDCDPNPRRELFTDNKIELCKNILNNINSLTNGVEKEFHIYSQGDESNFDFLEKLNLNIKFHIEEYPSISLYHMINSDVLITANSSFSYISHLLGKKSLSLVRDTFFHKWKPNSISLDEVGNFNIILFNNFLNLNYDEYSRC